MGRFERIYFILMIVMLVVITVLYNVVVFSTLATPDLTRATMPHPSTLRVTAATSEARSRISANAYEERIQTLEKEVTTLRKKAATKTVAPAKKKAVVRQASYSGGVAKWKPLATKHFGRFGSAVVKQALLCVDIESKGNPNARNGDYIGLFQMDSGWGSVAQRMDPEWAFRNAANSYAKKGWSAWPPMVKRGY